jgi:hypothetical protein
MGAAGGVLAAPLILAGQARWPTPWIAAQVVATIGAFIAAAACAGLAKRRLDIARAEQRTAQRPIVVTVRDTDPSTPGVHYYAVNVGRGTAINVWYAAQQNNELWSRLSLGALGPGERRRLPDAIAHALRNEAGDLLHVVAAEGVHTRTTRWTLTANMRGLHRGDSMRHQLIKLRKPERESLMRLLKTESGNIARQLQRIPSANDQI